LMNSLYPDTSYGVESGGDPEVIPKLTYEQFLDFHRKYYHPSNSYIYLYGNMDMAEKLTFIDEQYLSAFEALEVDSALKKQPAFTERNRVVKEYPVGEDEEETDNSYLAWNVTVGSSLDRDLYVAFQILDYALCSAPGAPLKQTLIDKGIGKDVYSIYENGIMQPYFSVVAKNADAGQEEEFLALIREVLQKLSAEGIDPKALLAGINYYEFKYREADFGSYPKGLMYGLQILDSWLYDDAKPFVHIEANETFKKLREKVETGYFEELVKKYLLDNTHKSIVILKPRKGLTEERDNALKAQLSEKKASLSTEEIEKIVADTIALREYQESEDSKEDLEKIPLLSREDIGRDARRIIYEERKFGDIPVLFHSIFTNGIGYLRMIFKVQDIPGELFPYIGILKGCLGLLNTENYKYGDLFNEVNIMTGGMAAVNNAYANVDDLNQYQLTMEIKTKVLYENIGKAIELMQEILMTSDFADTKRLYEIIAEGKSRMQGQMMSAGHNVAVNRALSYGSVSGQVSELISGIPFYRFSAELTETFDAKKEELVNALKALAKMIFRKENLMVDFIGTEEGLEKVEAATADFAAGLYDCPVEKGALNIEVSRKNEAFMTSGQVQYVCRAGNFRRTGLPYTGALRMLKVMMGYDYLWNNIRVKGGAYGCMCNFGKSGESYFVSYRDPNLQKTIDVYEKAADTIAAFDADERTLTQYLIGAISDLDIPMNPSAAGLFSLSAYMTGLTQEMLQKERDELIAATAEDIRGLAEYIRAFMSEEFLCVVGNAEKIKEVKEIFGKVENLV